MLTGGLPLVFQERHQPAGRFLSVLVHFDDTLYEFYRRNANAGSRYLPTVWGIGHQLITQLQDGLDAFCRPSKPPATTPSLSSHTPPVFKGFSETEGMFVFGNFRPKQSLTADNAQLYARRITDCVLPFLLWENATIHNPERPVRVSKELFIAEKEYARIEVHAILTEEEEQAILDKDLVRAFAGRGV